VPEDHPRAAPSPQAAHAVTDASPVGHAQGEAPGVDAPAAGSQAAELITSTFLVISCVLSWFAFVDVGFGGHDARISLFTFITSGDLKTDWALRIDPLTAVMLVVVTTISSLVHIYSIGYMAEDPYKPRFLRSSSSVGKASDSRAICSSASGTTSPKPMRPRSKPSSSTASATLASRWAFSPCSC
jgi:hypothetical protein